MTVVGIDIGATGGIAALTNGAVSLSPMPTISSVVNGRRRILIDEAALCKLIVLAKPGLVVFEPAIAMPRQSVVATKTTCENVGFVRGVLTAAQIPFIACRPQTWQRLLYAGVDGAGKTRSLIVARRLYPGVELQAAQHGMADALLLATWGLLQLADQARRE